MNAPLQGTGVSQMQICSPANQFALQARRFSIPRYNIEGLAKSSQKVFRQPGVGNLHETILPASRFLCRAFFPSV
jgi:hypothetical protein